MKFSYLVSYYFNISENLKNDWISGPEIAFVGSLLDKTVSSDLHTYDYVDGVSLNERQPFRTHFITVSALTTYILHV